MSGQDKTEFTFNWEIENFTFLAYNTGECLTSPVFKVDTLYETSWFLRLFPSGTIRSKGPIVVHLCRTDIGVKEICIGFTIEFIDPVGTVVLCKTVSNHEFKRNGYFRWFKCLTVDKLNCYKVGTITIRCKIHLEEPTVGITAQCKARTKISTDRCSFRWKVKNIDSSSWKDERIFSFSKTRHINVTLTAPEDSVNITMKIVDTKMSKFHFVVCKIILFDEKGIKQESKQAEHLFTSKDENNIWEFPSFLQNSKIQDKGNKYLKNGTFTLIFEFTVCNDSVLNYIEDCDKSEFVVSKAEEEDTVAILQLDLQRMFIENIGTDISLCTEDKTFKAHKFLLSTRSPVFDAMFKNDMLENQTGVVNIPDVEGDILKSFLNFMYTGILNKLDFESASKLLIVANRYQVPSLEEKCSFFLMSNLSIVNVCDVAVVADLVGNETLKSYAIDLIVSHADTILTSEDWSRCIQNNTKLAGDIYKKLAINTMTTN